MTAASAPATRPRITIVYVTAGAGHRRAAEAITESLRATRPEAEVSCVDLLDYGPAWLRSGYPCSYEWLVERAPVLWKAGYVLSDRGFVAIQPLRRLWNAAVTGAFRRHLRESRPEVIVATHFFVTDIVAAERERGAIEAHLVTVVTDLYPHRFWLTKQADAVVVAGDETRALCERRGIDPRRLHALGIPVSERFGAQAAIDRGETLATYRLDPARVTVLLTSGGMGSGPIKELVDGLVATDARHPGRLQVVVVCGHNHALAARLQARAFPMPVRVFGFVDTMPELMAMSDLLITKAGGLTVTEALAVGAPMVLIGVIPGQERMNADYVVRHGAAVEARDTADAIAQVERLIVEGGALAAMRQRAKALGRPQAARRIGELILALRSS